MFEAIFGLDSLPPFLIVLEITFFVFIGLSFGSFSSVLIKRIPEGRPWAFAQTRSACGTCKTLLTARDLVPLFSWLLNKGQCRTCGAKVPAFYPLLEIGAAILCIFVSQLYQGSIEQMLLLLVTIPFLLALSIIDFEHKRLPNQLVLIVAGMGALSFMLKLFEMPYQWEGLTLNYIGGAAVYFLITLLLGIFMKRVLKKEALGLGDVKFFAAAGLWIGIENLPLFMILSGMFGVIIGILWRLKTKQSTFPFGPALILSLFLILSLDGSFFMEKTLQWSGLYQ